MKTYGGMLIIVVLLASCAEKPVKNDKSPAISMVERKSALDDDWSVRFEKPYSRRTEDGSLVFWRPSSTLWISVWPNPQPTPEVCYEDLRREISTQAFDIVEESANEVQRFAYRLDEPSKDRRQPAFYGYAARSEDNVPRRRALVQLCGVCAFSREFRNPVSLESVRRR
jgi:hypothetical protein